MGTCEMINHPEILKKAIEELDRVFGKEMLVQESDFYQLNYIKACAREAFILHPIAAFNVLHVSMSDTKVANCFIAKGRHDLLSRFGLRRDPKVWPNEPFKFKPERHLKEDGSEVVNDLRCISFGTGRRGCLGVTLETSMIVMLFARVLQAFTWTAPQSETKIDLSEAEDSLALAKPLIAVAKPRYTKVFRLSLCIGVRNLLRMAWRKWGLEGVVTDLNGETFEAGAWVVCC
ncbi:hypothetical protein Dsin_028045 [Dipteronia sinensis]|uniref:Cytochrome P450 n=1 Tax=Dipteronia sinensis TaxID=43782 RepID=A0AAE0DU74_9ROSI|nr:hypothetical protein Dsin_028045 [Dipteronia sinensis]